MGCDGESSGGCTRLPQLEEGLETICSRGSNARACRVLQARECEQGAMGTPAICRDLFCRKAFQLRK